MGRYPGEFEQLVLLAVVQLEGEAYGVAIREEIERRTGRDVAMGAVYTTLDRLEGKGYLRSSVGEPTPERGGRRKKFYRLRAAGQEAMAESWRALRRMAEGLEPDKLEA